jgi:hypothetical protein
MKFGGVTVEDGESIMNDAKFVFSRYKKGS